jgi:hypothetical protein
MVPTVSSPSPSRVTPGFLLLSNKATNGLITPKAFDLTLDGSTTYG